MKRRTVVIPLYEGVTHLDFTGPHQVLSRVPLLEVKVASLGGADVTADGLTFTGLTDLAQIEGCDILCIPGGFGATSAMLDEDFMRQIRRLGAGAEYLTSVCTGSLILAAAGFLTGKRAACHWAWRELLVPFGAVVAEERVARDGKVITGGGVTAGVDFAFVLLAELFGEEIAQTVQLGLEYAPQPPFEAGRPELAPAPVRVRYESLLGELPAQRMAQAREAAARLEPAV